MTEEQKSIFIQSAQLGWACGLMHPYEWLVNSVRALQHWCAYEDIPEERAKIWKAYIAFFKGTASGPYDEEELRGLTAEKLSEKINAWYDRATLQNTMEPHEKMKGIVEDG